jgi:hypothetical protein
MAGLHAGTEAVCMVTRQERHVVAPRPEQQGGVDYIVHEDGR